MLLQLHCLVSQCQSVFVLVMPDLACKDRHRVIFPMVESLRARSTLQFVAAATAAVSTRKTDLETLPCAGAVPKAERSV